MSTNWAIVIGINQYCCLQPLQYAVQDAAALKGYFYQEMYFRQVYHFADPLPSIQQNYGPPFASMPTFSTLERFLRVRFDRPFLPIGHNLWFFFAGHGIRQNARDYLMPIDGDPRDVEGTAIPLSYVSERLQRSGAGNVILLIDACRDEARCPGIGEEVQQGVITLFSCSPYEVSSEVEDLRHGTFTYTLLHGLRRQRRGNCATVKRLDQYLSHYVPKVNRYFNKPRQTPYMTVESATQYHLILQPQKATLHDLATLKLEALKAEDVGMFEFAEQLWVRVLDVSPEDPEAIAGMHRLIPLIFAASSQMGSEPFESSIELPDRSPAEATASSTLGADQLPLKLFSFEVITVNAQGQETQRRRQQARGWEEDLGNGITLTMLEVEGGTFTMGAPPNERGLPEILHQFQ